MPTIIAKLVTRLNPFARYGPCRGVTIFRLGRFKAELWFAPKWYAPPEHTHDNSDGEFTILWARNRPIYRVVNGHRQWYTARTPRDWGRFLSVRAGTPHAFLKGDSFMVWICFERWKPGVSVTSVATDFNLT